MNSSEHRQKTWLIFLFWSSLLLPMPKPILGSDYTQPEANTVSNHNLIYTNLQEPAQFTGNGSIAMSVDVTGTQLLLSDYTPQTIFTIAQNIWHDPPLPDTLKGIQLSRQKYPHGENHTLEYANPASPIQSKLYDFLRKYPNKFSLFNVALTLSAGGQELSSAKEVTDINQMLDLNDGIIRTQYRWNGVTAVAETYVHAEKDLLVFHFSDNAATPISRNLRIQFGSPDAWDPRYEKAPPAAKVSPGGVYALGESGCSKDRQSFWTLRAMPGDFSYAIVGRITAKVATVSFLEQEMLVELAPYSQQEFTIVLSVTSAKDNKDPIKAGKQAVADALSHSYEELARNHSAWWHDYWNRAGIDLYSADGKGKTLERWYYLSLYHLACNDRGILPPAEGGLVANSWYGKFHLEMHFWHAIGFLAANRPDMLAPSLPWYLQILPQAKLNAAAMGLQGAKYPKMTSFPGKESPGSTNLRIYWHVGEIPTIIWWYYLYTGDEKFLQRMYPVLQNTAEFVRSFVVENPKTGVYEILPPVATCDETTIPDSVRNPGFTLAEFNVALDVAAKAAKQLSRDEEMSRRWQYVRNHLAPIPHNGEAYLIYQNFAGTWTPKHTRSHPSVLGPFFPTRVVSDDRLIRTTFDNVLSSWNWDKTWGWDFGFTAAVGACLKRPNDAVNVLMHAEKALSPAVTFRGGSVNSYLPGNGALVMAINEMLLQSLDGYIRLFRGIPAEWQVGFHSLRAAGAFLVSAKMKSRVVAPIQITSLKGNPCRVEIPAGWTLEHVRVTSNDKRVPASISSDRIVEFKTKAGSIYRIFPSSE